MGQEALAVWSDRRRVQPIGEGCRKNVCGAVGSIRRDAVDVALRSREVNRVPVRRPDRHRVAGCAPM